VDDIDALTALHCACFGPDDHVPVLLGEPFLKAMYRWQVSGREAFTVVAESGDLPIAFGGACDVPYMWPMLRACFPQFLISLLRNPMLLVDGRLWRRLFYRQKALDEQARRMVSSPGMAHLTTVAVEARFRGMGVAGAVVEALEAITMSRGRKALCTGMRRTNRASRRVIVKRGWVEVPAPESSEMVYYIAYLDLDPPCPN
jgi:ribosomal protein S18 acetylase RimI-like enzyme